MRVSRTDRHFTWLVAGIVMFVMSSAGGQQHTPRYTPAQYTPGAGRPHTYDPFSTKDDAVAGLDHEPKKPGEKGRWVAKSFRISCATDQGLSKETYLHAAVGSEKMEGDDCYGAFLHVFNKSSKYPAYFGIDHHLNTKVEPRQRTKIPLTVDQDKSKIRIAVTTNLFVKVWDDQAGSVKTAGTKQ